MPIFKQFAYQNAQIAVWKITEQLDDLLKIADLSKFDFENYEKLIHHSKKTEWLASRILIETVAEKLNLLFSGIVKDSNGKLHLMNHSWHISISHSREFVAAVFHETKKCGIDLEAEKPKLLKVSPRVLSESELAFVGEDLSKHCIFWSAKEALFKLYGKKEVDFKENLLLETFDIYDNQAVFRGKFIKNVEKLNCQFQATKIENLWLIVALEID